MKKHYGEIVRAADRAVDRYMKMTVDGGIRGADGIITPGASIGCVLGYAGTYYCGDSRHFKSEKVIEHMENALSYTEAVQREDGTFDLLISNFHSAPDTGFIMHNMYRTYRVMEKYASSQREKTLLEKLYGIIEKASKGLRDGGFHTPNHRWVEAAGLAMAYNITGDESMKDMALMYLGEGIDIDENGEFTERSPGIYNAVNDNALMILSEQLSKPELLGYASKNLEMMFSYFEPDGSVFTQNSVRVDKGEGKPGKSFYPTNYYFLYLKAAYLTGNTSFAAMADRIFESAIGSGRGVPGVLWMYMLMEELRDYEPEAGEIPDEFEVHYKPSNIVRKRKKDLSVTLLGGSPNFLFVQKGNLRCYVRICASFFAVAQFRADEIIYDGSKYIMEFTARGSYRWPFENPPETSVWEEMDHNMRKSVNHLELKYTVTAVPADDGVSFSIRTTGCDRVPIKVEFCLTGGCRVEGDGFMVEGKPGSGITAAKGTIRATLDLDTLEIGPAFAMHTYDSAMRGSEPRDMNGFTVYFTEFTNIDRTIHIKAV